MITCKNHLCQEVQSFLLFGGEDDESKMLPEWIVMIIERYNRRVK